MACQERPEAAYPEIPADRAGDLHNLDRLGQADLILFMAGNQFMVMPELLAAFQAARPEVETIVHETLPPGLELRQILAGGAVFRGYVIRVRPDIYSAVSREAMDTLAERGLVEPSEVRVYLHNRLALMVPAGNPRGIAGVRDLGREDVLVSQPSPENEHIAVFTERMYEQAGGSALAETVLEAKRSRGRTLMTTVHHRETPQRLLRGEADVGPVWHTEILEARRAGLEVQGIEVGPDLDQRDQVDYLVAPLKTAEHREQAEWFLTFIRTPQAAAIFERYGFLPEP